MRYNEVMSFKVRIYTDEEINRWLKADRLDKKTKMKVDRLLKRKTSISRPRSSTD